MAALLDSIEYRALVRCFDTLVIVVQYDLLPFVNHLYAKAFIGREVYERMLTPALPNVWKATELVVCVISQVKVHPERYYEFLELLKSVETRPFTDIHDLLMTEYSKLLSQT